MGLIGSPVPKVPFQNGENFRDPDSRLEVSIFPPSGPAFLPIWMRPAITSLSRAGGLPSRSSNGAACEIACVTCVPNHWFDSMPTLPEWSRRQPAVQIKRRGFIVQ